MQLYVDMDGVLADFDAHHHATFGVKPDKVFDNVDWKAVRETPNFYANIPPMKDMRVLWNGIQRYKPIILTGVPASVAEAADNKRAWVRKHLGKHVKVIGALSREKYLHASPGDILIDDWEKHRAAWEAVGGIWITHTSAKSTLKQLAKIVKGTK